MIALLALVSALLLLFELVLIARVVLDWVRVLGVSSGRLLGRSPVYAGCCIG